MTDCPNVEMRELLPELLHDHLPVAERMRVEAHVGECEACMSELALLRSARRALARPPGRPADQPLCGGRSGRNRHSLRRQDGNPDA